jgi:hypothetical protein
VNSSGTDWPARYGQSSVVMPDGSIVLMGGYDGDNVYNDVWQSWDDGATWTQVDTSSNNPMWTPRYGQSSVMMPDGSIVLMGGYDGSPENDVWQSWDDGATWTQVDTSSNNPMWTPRYGQSSVVMPDGSIVLMGGQDISGRDGDVWQSWDDGTTWTQMLASYPPSIWTPRYDQSSVAMPDGSDMECRELVGNRLVGTIWSEQRGNARWQHRVDGRYVKWWLLL